MSRRTIAALAASVIFGIGFILSISTDALKHIIAVASLVAVSTAAAYTVGASTAVAITVVYVLEWQ